METIGTLVTVGTHLTDYGTFDMTVEGLATGGMGMVVWGMNTVRQRRTAAKLIRPDLLASSAYREAFINEALVWCRLWPNFYVNTAYGLTTLRNGSDELVLEMDYAERGTLLNTLQRAQSVGLSLSLGSSLSIAQQLAKALEAIHRPDPEHGRPTSLIHCALMLRVRAKKAQVE